jgi:CHAT domain-containing protein/tetratricopeptide (TPR) repeat protein
VSPEDLLKCSEADLERLAISISVDELQNLIQAIWERVRPLYTGQPKSIQSATGLALAQAALQLASRINNQLLLIEAWHLMGRSLSANEDFEKAIPFYRQVISGFEVIGDVKQAARARLALIGVLLNADRYEEAFEVAGVAEGLFVEHHDESGLARLYHNIANIYHRTDDHTRAYQYYLKAYQMFQALSDDRAIAHSCFNLGNVLGNLDRFEESDEMYARSIQLSQKLGMMDLWTQASYNRTYLDYSRGRYSAALEGFSRLRREFEAAGSLRHSSLCDLDEAEIYLQLNLSNDAVVLAARAAEQFEILGLRYEQAKATALYGVALMQQGASSKAFEVFQSAEEIFELENNRYWIGLLDLYRSEAHLTLQHYGEAYVLAEQAKAIFEQLAIPSRKIGSLVLLGRASLGLYDLPAAQRYSAEINEIVSALNMPLVLFSHHLLCAEIAERSKRPADAQSHYEAAVRELELHHARLHHDDLRVTFFKGRQQPFEALVRLSLNELDETDALSSAYAWCERARSRGLIELLSHCSPAGQGRVEPSQLSRINRLREDLNTYYARSHQERRPIRQSAGFENIALKEKELARILREVSAVDPEYASLQQVSIATLESVQAVLPKETTLVEYFTTSEELLAFVISARGAKVVRRVCAANRLSSLQEGLSFHLEAFMLGEDYAAVHAPQILESTIRQLHELYRCLVAPFVDDLRTPNLVIVPHGGLHFLPFHAFYDGARYLIDRFEISYAPSASVLKFCLEKGNVSDTSPLLVGVTDENAPMVDEEIARLRRMFPDAGVLLDKAATREAFVQKARTSSFLHIATHAIFREDNPMFSSFKLADGWCTAFDLFSMSCQTNLVTLSGCQSGITKISGADDLLGLMRGFLYAGARSLLLSLWNVNDESAAALMACFYQAWQQGATKSMALRRAMLNIRDRHPSPYHWAPFVLVGRP